MIVIVDYGSGNLRSVSKALDHLGAPNEVSADPRRIERADRLILPGVGAFGACVEGVRAGGFEPALRQFLATGRPFLGICVGMQILVETSEESPEARGLAVLRGHCPRFRGELKVPHMGWNEVRRNGRASRLLAGVPDGAYFYFVHSYHIEPAADERGHVVAWCHYGRAFPAVYEREHVFATQFHPEKSQEWGLKLLNNFARL